MYSLSSQTYGVGNFIAGFIFGFLISNGKLNFIFILLFVLLRMVRHFSYS